MTSVSLANSSTPPDSIGGRAVPWSQEAEQAVLGAMVIDGDAALRGAELLDDLMFYRVITGDVISPMTISRKQTGLVAC